ncbi:MAG: hypothetical protein J0653_00685, partial [Deltaproteobacteria bacterium]|nr:hypothetical protein [Deltaproteobacteria bacterium]
MIKTLITFLVCLAWAFPACAAAVISQGKLDKAIFTSYTSVKRVPVTRTVNGQPLSSNVTITAASLGAVPTTVNTGNTSTIIDNNGFDVVLSANDEGYGG